MALDLYNHLQRDLACFSDCSQSFSEGADDDDVGDPLVGPIICFFRKSLLYHLVKMASVNILEFYEIFNLFLVRTVQNRSGVLHVKCGISDAEAGSSSTGTVNASPMSLGGQRRKRRQEDQKVRNFDVWLRES